MNARAGLLMGRFGRNSGLIHRHAEGLTEAGALMEPAFEAISFNWLLGHIVRYRNVALRSLDAAPIWTPPLDKAYTHESVGAPAAEAPRSLAQLLVDLDQAETRLAEVLEDAPDAFLDKVVEFHLGAKTHFEHVAHYQWHETYHTGQLGILRSLALTAS